MQHHQVLGSVLFTLEPCRSYVPDTLQNAPRSEVSTQGVLYPQSMGYIPSVEIYTKCVCAVKCLYALKCVMPQSVYIPQVWYVHKVCHILQNVDHTLQCDDPQHVVYSP